ncbi:DUF5708 family protein [Streptomyces sp. NPDC005955]|uniref:DUF5708 family protein n=1 Tax=Streptomyces sp. NPDC005955 TaxID=3364738 RepID=UPI0036C2712E
MTRAARNLLEGVVIFALGLGLRLFADGVDTPVVELTKVGVVLMGIGAVVGVTGLFRSTMSRLT